MSEFITRDFQPFGKNVVVKNKKETQSDER